MPPIWITKTSSVSLQMHMPNTIQLLRYPRHHNPMYHCSKLHLTIEQKNSLKSLMKNTTDKKQNHRLLAILQKSNGRTFKGITKEHIVSIRSVQRWVFAYLENGTPGLDIKKTGSSQSRITDENKEIMFSVLFNDPNLFGYVRNTWNLRSLANCLTEELDIPISFKHLLRG